MQHRPKRSLGQNFLRDRSVVDRIIGALDVSPGEPVIEIGPGQGALTERLIKLGADVTAIEFDRELAPALRDRFLGANISVIEADALEVDFANLVGHPPAKLVANLPYNISTPILQRLIEHRDVFSLLVLMFQKEVVERIAAEPGNKERGFLSVVAQNAFEIEYLFDVPPGAFYPVPKVWSSVVRLTPKPSSEFDKKVREVVSLAFAQKRKTLANNIRSIHPNASQILKALGLPEKCRAEELSLDDWHRLVAQL
ncbi:MAG TPA: 16S rRNA (adenine(1518)-N(6)/adenine(1519)-N(6))-dimethyltransferase RsmA [Pyrinomonadaceae bacterium]|nr:16S rRNA (adenine(1518)-N(6)/adenine(1519)-N(6))-dimethyltransferase RsmA [Pyrinomonadaceae bacterium]